jgi:hypothetical protein
MDRQRCLLAASRFRTEDDVLLSFPNLLLFSLAPVRLSCYFRIRRSVQNAQEGSTLAAYVLPLLPRLSLVGSISHHSRVRTEDGGSRQREDTQGSVALAGRTKESGHSVLAAAKVALCVVSRRFPPANLADPPTISAGPFGITATFNTSKDPLSSPHSSRDVEGAFRRRGSPSPSSRLLSRLSPTPIRLDILSRSVDAQPHFLSDEPTRAALRRRARRRNRQRKRARGDQSAAGRPWVSCVGVRCRCVLA